MRALLMMAAVGSLGVIGCSSSDPCDGLGATCVGVTVMSAGGNITFDQLDVNVSGNVNGMRVLPTMPKNATLPQSFALEFNPPSGFSGNFGFDLTVTAMLHGAGVAKGTTHVQEQTGTHSTTTVQMIAGSGPGNMTGPDMAGKSNGGNPADMATHD